MSNDRIPEWAPGVVLDANVCRDYERSSQREWLETNGVGGFAFGTVSGAHTRRYHGLLVAALNSPADRYVLLSKLEEILLTGDQRYELSSNQYRMVVQPQGHRYLRQFRLEPYPVWVFEVGSVEVEKSLFMVYGENTTVVRYRMLNTGSEHFAVLALRPLLAYREYHHLTTENSNIHPQPEAEEPGFLQIRPYEALPPLTFCHNGFGFTVSPDWYRRFEYLSELERGLDYSEDLFSPGYFSFELSQKSPSAYLLTTTGEPSAKTQVDIDLLEFREKDRRQALFNCAEGGDAFIGQLILSADAFVVRGLNGHSTIAGYPWFGERKRDAMISLPGLTLVPRRFELARSVVSTFMKWSEGNTLPNELQENQASPICDSADAGLWLFRAVHEYLIATQEFDFVRESWFPGLIKIIDQYLRSTSDIVQVDPADGLLVTGPGGEAQTWMNVRIKGKAVTPRHGKTVEINALWHNALKVMEDISGRLGMTDKQQEYSHLADKIRHSFNQVFWNPEDQCLYDCVAPGRKERKIRPNQILAVSLPFQLLPPERAKAVVAVVHNRLLTPYGLRSLDPADMEYRGIYRGNVIERDRAYHQGTVWPWLLGPFVDAFLTVHGESAETCDFLLHLLESFRSHLSDALLGSISEMFDGEPPHWPRGCGAQAWSVAEVLRSYTRLIRLNRSLSDSGTTESAQVAS